MQIITGHRIGKGTTLMVGCAAVLFDEKREKILLTRRSDNGRWCLPGGRMESGESATEACVREVLEETHLRVRATKLVGIYTTPDLVIQYKDGNRHQLVAMCFECQIIGGELGLSDETTEYGWFAPAQIEAMDLVEHHRQRIKDVAENQIAPFVR